MEVEVPDKLYFKIGEVAEIASLKPSILRYWETEFTQLKPVKSGSGQRLYARKDLELVLRIKSLLYEERLTIAGARKMLATTGNKDDSAGFRDKKTELLLEIRDELKSIRNLL